MADIKTPGIEEMIGLDISRRNMAASLQHLEDAFRADLQVRDMAYRLLERRVDALEARLEHLESERGVTLNETAGPGDRAPVQEQTGPADAESRAPDRHDR